MVVGRGPANIGGRLSFTAEVAREKNKALGKKLMNAEGSPDWTTGLPAYLYRWDRNREIQLLSHPSWTSLLLKAVVQLEENR